MIHYVSLEIVLQIHDQLIDQYGGIKGILNVGLLQSALETPKAVFAGRQLHRTIYDKAAAYLFHISKNYPFIDGNKRTAGMISMVFLASNNINFSVVDSEYEALILSTAKGEVSKKQIAKFFRNANAVTKKK